MTKYRFEGANHNAEYKPDVYHVGHYVPNAHDHYADAYLGTADPRGDDLQLWSHQRRGIEAVTRIEIANARERRRNYDWGADVGMALCLTSAILVFGCVVALGYLGLAWAAHRG